MAYRPPKDPEIDEALRKGKVVVIIAGSPKVRVEAYPKDRVHVIIRSR